MEQQLTLKNEIMKINIESLEKSFETKIKNIEKSFETKIKNIEKSFETKFDRLEKRFETKFEYNEKRINQIQTQMIEFGFSFLNHKNYIDTNFNYINSNFENINLLIENNKIEKCCVCYEFTSLRSSCNHFLCQECYDKLEKIECPMCRNDLL